MEQPVIVAGVRTPFVRSHHAYVDFSSYDLARFALKGLLQKNVIDPNLIEYVVMGTVIHDAKTSNVAREALIGSGLPIKIPANTVTMACISANVAATQIADMIIAGRIHVGIFGGTDTCSDPPIRVAQNLRKTLVRLEKVKSFSDLLSHWPTLSKLRFKDLIPEVPTVAEFSNGKSMGQGGDILAQMVGVSRHESDEYAVRSHMAATRAWSEGKYKGDVVPVFTNKAPVTQDDGFRPDSTIDKLSKIRPAFDKTFGVNTAGNSSFLTDGASAVLMMSRTKADELGVKALAVLKDYCYTAGDALLEMLSGPALSIPKLLERNQLKVSDIGVWEIHEAFAGQIVANLKLLRDPKFAKDRLGMSNPVGEIPLDQLNAWGGSLSLGHPFGATGGRLLWTAAKRLQETGSRYAVVSGCAAGGHGSAILLENPERGI